MATRSLGQLTLDLIAKTMGFERGMDKASRKAKKTGDDIDKAFKTAMKTVFAFAGSVGIGYLLKQQIDLADQTGELAMQLGTTAEELSTLTFAAQMTGASQDDLRLAIRRLARGIDEGVKGSGTYGAALKELGVATTDAEGRSRSATDVLGDLADLFQKLPDGAEKTAIAYKVLGDNGQRLIPLLNEGRAGMQRLQQQARDLGLEISTEAAASAALFNDNLDLLKGTMDGFVRAIAMDAVPRINDIVAAMQEANRESGLMMAAWVGLGGVGQSLFVDDLNEDIEELTEHIRELEAASKGAGASAATFARFGLTGPGIEDRLLELRTQLARLEVERDKAAEAEEQRAKDALRQQAERQASLLAEQDALRERIRLQEEARQAEADAERRRAEIDKTLAALKEEQETLGMTAEELVRYRLAVLGATDAEIALAVAAQQVISDFREQEKQAEQSAKQVEEFWRQAAHNMQDAMAAFFYEMDGDTSEMLENFANAIRQMLAQALAFQTLNGIPGLGALLSPTPTPAGGNALGGAAMPGQLRSVNEQGPELLSVGGRDYLMMGNQQGKVTPNSRLGGITVNAPVDARGAMSPEQIFRALELLEQRIYQNIPRLLQGFAPA